MRPKVSLIKCGSYQTKEVERAVKESVAQLGGIEKFIRPAERVLLKPNLLGEAAPEEGVDTHPEVVRAVIRLVRPITNNIYCGDSPGVWEGVKDVDKVYEVSGIKKICLEEGVGLVYFNNAKIKKGYALTDWLDKCDRLISIPKFKTHGFTILTAGIKNLFGLVVGMSKMKIHRDNLRPDELSRSIVDIYEARKSDLTILDAIVAMEGDGPTTSGTLRNMNLIAASPDALALDMVLTYIMNIKPEKVPTNREAIKRGLGPKDLSSIEVLGLDLDSLIVRDFKLPKVAPLHYLPEWVTDLAKYFFQMWPYANPKKCKACGVCEKICPVEAITITDNRVLIDRKKCIFCLCCQEVCPHRAIEVRKSFIWRVLSAMHNFEK